MRDQEDDAPTTPVSQVAHQGELGLGVQRRRRLVQDEHGRVLADRSRDRQTLPLACRQLCPPFTEQGVAMLSSALRSQRAIDANWKARAVNAHSAESACGRVAPLIPFPDARLLEASHSTVTEIFSCGR